MGDGGSEIEGGRCREGDGGGEMEGGKVRKRNLNTWVEWSIFESPHMK